MIVRLRSFVEPLSLPTLSDSRVGDSRVHVDSETDTQAGVTTPSGNPPYNTDATIGDNPSGSKRGGSSLEGEAR